MSTTKQPDTCRHLLPARSLAAACRLQQGLSPALPTHPTPRTDYLPSPLDVNNFAFDLDKSEDKVLLPCSR